MLSEVVKDLMIIQSQIDCSYILAPKLEEIVNSIVYDETKPFETFELEKFFDDKNKPTRFRDNLQCLLQASSTCGDTSNKIIDNNEVYTVSECESLCRANPECTNYKLRDKTNISTYGVCGLYRDCSDWVKTQSVHHYSLTTNDLISTQTDLSLSACNTACNQDSECKEFTYKEGLKECSLFRQTCSLVSESNEIAFYRPTKSNKDLG